MYEASLELQEYHHSTRNIRGSGNKDFSKLGDGWMKGTIEE